MPVQGSTRDVPVPPDAHNYFRGNTWPRIYGEVRKAMMTMELVRDMNAQAQGGPNVPGTLLRAAVSACNTMENYEGHPDYEEKRIAYAKALNKHELYCELWCSNRRLLPLMRICTKALMKETMWKTWQRLGLVPMEYKIGFPAMPIQPAASSSTA